MQNRGPYCVYFLKPFAQGWSSQYMWKKKKVAINGVSKSLETSFFSRWPCFFFSFFFEQQYSHPQCKWCLKVLIQTDINVASVRLTSSRGSGEKFIMTWSQVPAHIRGRCDRCLFVCVCACTRECGERKLSVFLFILGKDYGSETTGRESLEGGGLNIDYKRKEKKNRKQKSKKKSCYILFFSLKSQSLRDEPGSCYMMFLIWACSV